MDEIDNICRAIGSISIQYTSSGTIKPARETKAKFEEQLLFYNGKAKAPGPRGLSLKCQEVATLPFSRLSFQLLSNEAARL